MPENTMAANLVQTRGNRVSATMLSWLEDNVYEFLEEDLQRRTRQMVLDNVNGFKDLTIDIVKSDTAYMNQLWVEKLDEIHKEIRRNGAAHRDS